MELGSLLLLLLFEIGLGYYFGIRVRFLFSELWLVFYFSNWGQDIIIIGIKIQLESKNCFPKNWILG